MGKPAPAQIYDVGDLVQLVDGEIGIVQHVGPHNTYEVVHDTSCDGHWLIEGHPYLWCDSAAIAGRSELSVGDPRVIRVRAWQQGSAALTSAGIRA